MANRTWQDKAHWIIAYLCKESYLKTNINPRTKKLYKKHRPYSVPEEAEFLMNCLNRNDEERAKAYFIQLAYRS